MKTATDDGAVINTTERIANSSLAPMNFPEWMRYRTVRIASARAVTTTTILAGLLGKLLARSILKLVVLTAASIRIKNSSPANKVDTVGTTAEDPDAKFETRPSMQPLQTLSSGVRIVNKRKIDLHVIGSIHDVARTPADSPPRRFRRGRHILKTSADSLKKSGLNLFGRLARYATQCPLPEAIPHATLGRIIWNNKALRGIFGSISDVKGDFESLLPMVADNGVCDLRPTVLWWMKQFVSPTLAAEIVERDFHDTARHNLNPRIRTFLIRCAVHAAPALSDKALNAVFSSILSSVRTRIDPYRSEGGAGTLRAAAVSLLRERPELDETVFRSLELQRGVPNANNTSIPVEAHLLAIASRDRIRDYGKTFMQIVDKADLSPQAIHELATASDAATQRPPRSYQAPRDRTVWHTVLFRRLASWLLIPLSAALIGLIAESAEWTPARFNIGFAESLGLLALLVTVNVLTVELSASRLPGVISRYAGQPWQVFTCYSGALLLLALSSTKEVGIATTFGNGWISVTTLALFVISLLITIILLLSQTDAGRATSGFVSVTLPAARAAGRRLGRIQAISAEIRDSLTTSPDVKFGQDAVIGSWSNDIVSARRGIFVPSRRKVRRLLTRTEFRHGMRVRILTGFGTIVAANEPVASLMPGRDQIVSKKLTSIARQAMDIRSSKKVEHVASGCVALTRLSLDLARLGDVGTSHVVAQNAVRLVLEHVSAARVARQKEYTRQSQRAATKNPLRLRDDIFRASAKDRIRDEKSVAAIPALRDTLRITVDDVKTGSDNQFSLPTRIIAPLLTQTLEPDSAVSILSFAVPARDLQDEHDITELTELLRLAGVRALELNSHQLLNLVLDQLMLCAKLPKARSTSLSIVSAIGATACRFDQRLAQACLFRLLEQRSTDDASPVGPSDVVSLWRIGASALDSGIMSVAVQVVVALKQLEVDSWVLEKTNNETFLSEESARAEIRGAYLGEQSMDALSNFGHFLAALISRVGAPDAGHE